MNVLVDGFGRRIDYLRVSVTDRCNFRCIYCMPEQGFPATPKEEHLTTAEFIRLIEAAADLGMTKLRLTGGEPLLRKELPEIIQAARAAGFVDISLTTNGHLLAEQATALKQAGLSRVNVSLDTLRDDRFQEIARRGSLLTVLNGIEAAMVAGLAPVKINCVVLKGLNDDEAANFAEWTLRAPLHVRFIELMPMRWNLDSTDAAPLPPHSHCGGCEASAPGLGESTSVIGPIDTHHTASVVGRVSTSVPATGLLQLKQARGDMLSDAEMRRRYVSISQLKAAIEQAHGALEPAHVQTNGPARTFRLAGARGTVGFISQISNDLCSNCNRLRLTHDGYLRPCLMSDGELDLRTTLRSGASDEELRDLFRHVVEHKPERHYLHEGQRVVGRGMSQIGG